MNLPFRIQKRLNNTHGDIPEDMAHGEGVNGRDVGLLVLVRGGAALREGRVGCDVDPGRGVVCPPPAASAVQVVWRLYCDA